MTQELNVKTYDYQGTRLCTDCAEKIRRKLTRRGIRDNGNSNEYPQGPHPNGGGPDDCCLFCSEGRHCVHSVEMCHGRRIGLPLANPLTAEGIVATTQSIVSDMVDRSLYIRALSRLIRAVWADYLGIVRPTRVPPKFASRPPESLVREMRKFALERGQRNTRDGYDSSFYADLDAVYLIYNTEKHTVVNLLRIPIDEGGEFSGLQSASVPREVIDGQQPEDVLAAALDEGAWDL